MYGLDRSGPDQPARPDLRVFRPAPVELPKSLTAPRPLHVVPRVVLMLVLALPIVLRANPDSVEAVGLVGGALFLLTILLVGEDLHQAVHALIWIALVGLLLLYGLALSWDDNLAQGAAFAVRWLPVALVPAFAFFVRGEKQWRDLIVWTVVVGTVGSLEDLYTWVQQGAAVVRLWSFDFYDVSYVFAFGAAVFLLVMHKLRPWQIVVVLACLPVLGLRTLLAISRIDLLLLGLAFAYGLVASVVVLGKHKGQVLVGLGLAVVLCLGLLLTVPQVASLIPGYLATYQTRFGQLDMSIQYRIVEVQIALGLSTPLGAGWGANGNFSAVQAFTSASSAGATPVKSYIHNLFGYLIWKLGAIGVACIVLGLGWLARKTWTVIRDKDPLGLTFVGLGWFWILFAMVDLSWASIALNGWLALWVGYLVRPRPRPAARPA